MGVLPLNPCQGQQLHFACGALPVRLDLHLVYAVCIEAEAKLHRCVQQHGQCLGAKGPHSSGCGVLQCSFADQPEPGVHLCQEQLHGLAAAVFVVYCIF